MNVHRIIAMSAPINSTNTDAVEKSVLERERLKNNFWLRNYNE